MAIRRHRVEIDRLKNAQDEQRRLLDARAAQEQQEGNKKKRLHFNPEDEDDDFGAATTAYDSDNADAHSGDEAVEEEEGEPSESQVSRASLNYHFEKQDTPTVVISTGKP